jgi:predicted MPP superfamily phosphohydrolase
MWIIIRLLIGIAILLIVEFYFVKRLNIAVKHLFPKFYENRFRLVRRIYLIWVNLYPLVLIFIFTHFAITGSYLSSPEEKIMDYFLIYPFWINFLLMLQTGIYFLIIDLISLYIYPVRFDPFYYPHNIKKKERIMSWISKLMFVILVFFVVYVPIRIIYDYNSVSIRKVEYKKENLAPSLENFKLVFITDIQADHYTDEGRLSNYINKVNSLNPDLILIAGDLITTGPDYIQLSAREVGKLKAKYGIYSCIGDHDNWAYRNDYEKSLQEVKSALNYNGVEMIDNSIKVINVDSAEIAITFITATYVEDVPKVVLDSLSINNNGDFKILLTHQPQPEIIETARKNNFNLFLAGHTHGGQITLVFPFILLTPTMIETKYIRGDFWFDSMLMIISRGLGMSLAPIRYNSTPEVTLIKLKNSK